MKADIPTTISTIPLRFSYGRSSHKVLEPVNPNASKPLAKGQRPSKRARKLANALWLEDKLLKGEILSLKAAREAFGITKSIQDRLMDLLDLPPEEMEEILNEVY